MCDSLIIVNYSNNIAWEGWGGAPLSSLYAMMIISQRYQSLLTFAKAVHILKTSEYLIKYSSHCLHDVSQQSILVHSTCCSANDTVDAFHMTPIPLGAITVDKFPPGRVML
jgi:hypothetical protein